MSRHVNSCIFFVTGRKVAGVGAFERTRSTLSNALKISTFCWKTKKWEAFEVRLLVFFFFLGRPYVFRSNRRELCFFCARPNLGYVRCGLIQFWGRNMRKTDCQTPHVNTWHLELFLRQSYWVSIQTHDPYPSVLWLQGSSHVPTKKSEKKIQFNMYTYHDLNRYFGNVFLQKIFFVH